MRYHYIHRYSLASHACFLDLDGRPLRLLPSVCPDRFPHVVDKGLPSCLVATPFSRTFDQDVRTPGDLSANLPASEVTLRALDDRPECRSLHEIVADLDMDRRPGVAACLFPSDLPLLPLIHRQVLQSLLDIQSNIGRVLSV